MSSPSTGPTLPLSNPLNLEDGKFILLLNLTSSSEIPFIDLNVIFEAVTMSSVIDL